MLHQPNTEMPNDTNNTAGSDCQDRLVHPLFIAEIERGGVEEIHDLCWFEESGVHNLGGDGHYSPYKIKATVETLITLMQLMTDDERMDVMGEFCRHCGDINPRCQCWNDE